MFQTLITKQVDAMHQYQKLTETRMECITNVKYLLDCLRYSNVDVNPCSVIAVGHHPADEANEVSVICGHLVLMVMDQLIDPSYDVAVLENTKYFFTVKDYKQFLKDHNVREYKSTAKEFCKFVKIANQIDKGTYDNFNEDYYKRISEYVNLAVF